MVSSANSLMLLLIESGMSFMYMRKCSMNASFIFCSLVSILSRFNQSKNHILPLKKVHDHF